MNEKKSVKRKSKPRGPGGGRGDLTIGEIIEVTLSLIRSNGLGQFSMRQLAQELAVTPTAVYYHLPHKQALLLMIAEHIVSHMAIPDATLDWRERLRLLVLEHQRTLLEYPGLARFMAGHRESPAVMQWSEQLLEILCSAGFSGAALMQAYTAIGFYINPLVLIDDKPHPGPNYYFHGGRLKRELSKQVERYPRLAELQPQLAGLTYDVYFGAGLERLIEGLNVDLLEAKRAAVVINKNTRARQNKHISAE